MHVRNIHERRFDVPPDRIGVLLDGLGSPADRLWPMARWPAMRLDRALQIGAVGGHGPIRYRVESYERGSKVRFQLLAPRGFDGFHGFEILPGATGTTLRHVLEMNARGPAVLTWPIVFRPLHDALVEDGLDTASRELGVEPRRRQWSFWVRMLRRAYRLWNK
jgi:hypothetical protein